MFDVGDRQVHLSPSVAENAFQPRNQQFSLQDAQEDILSNDRILPLNSSETSMLQPDSQSSQNIGYVLENFMKNTQPITFGKNVQLGEDLWDTAYLILTEPTPYLALQYEDDWVHFIHIPLMTGSILEKFYTFEKDDRYYLRLFGQNATNQIRLVSISIPDADAVMEVKDLSLQ